MNTAIARRPRALRPTSLKTCYLSAPAGADVSVLHTLLTERCIAIVADDGALPGYASTAGAIAQLVDRSDFVIACITGAQTDPQIFSIGVARGASRPVLLIVSPGLIEPPAIVGSIYAVHAEPTDARAIAFALDQLLRGAPISRTAVSVQPVERVPLGYRANEFLRTLHAILNGAADKKRDLVQLVAAVLHAGGADSVYVNPGEAGADLAVWDDNLEAMHLNPLLIQVEPTLNEASSIADPKRAALLQPSGSQLVVLLYGTGEAPALDLRRDQGVLVLSIEELLRRMRDRSFAEVVAGLCGHHVNGHAEKPIQPGAVARDRYRTVER
ncbi:MAG: hypothetical protein ACYDCQ_18235 [Dehalococcoidia bacterium]